jgi:predicted transcriptional regulator
MPASATSMRLTVGSVMHMGILECEPQTPLEDVARLMAQGDTHSVAVHGLTPEGLVRSSVPGASYPTSI